MVIPAYRLESTYRCESCTFSGDIVCNTCACRKCKNAGTYAYSCRRCDGCNNLQAYYHKRINERPPEDDTTESDPTGRGAHEPGAKLDQGKVLAGVLSDFSLALSEVAKVGTFGAEKYSRGGWQSVPGGITRYYDAAWRHLLKERHEPLDPDSRLLHQAHLAWNVLARLELTLRTQSGPAIAAKKLGFFSHIWHKLTRLITHLKF